MDLQEIAEALESLGKMDLFIHLSFYHPVLLGIVFFFRAIVNSQKQSSSASWVR